MSGQAPRPSPGYRRQLEIYQAGLAGQVPTLPVSAEALGLEAQSRLGPEVFDYLAGGAGGGATTRANIEAFERRWIVPRVLRDVSARDLGVEVLGHRWPSPVVLAPIGAQSIFHEEAERATARAAASVGVPLILSAVSSTTMEEVAGLMGDVSRWLQIYWSPNEELTASFLRRAEAAGYGAIVLTVDTPVFAWREADLRNAYSPFLRGAGLANYFSDPVFRRMVGGDPRDDPATAIPLFLKSFSDPSRTWDDLEHLCRATRLPVLVKGVLHPDDARAAVDRGAAGVVVSNHGGRQLEGAIASLDALPRVVDAVGHRTTVLFDGGIRRGVDVVKAIALGARAVLLGRPYCHGLTLGGESGVRDVLANLIADFDLTLGLVGFTSCGALSREIFLDSPPDAG